MSGITLHGAGRSAAHVAWVTLVLLLAPLAAMHFTDEVHWQVGDFAVAGALLFGAGFTFALVARQTRNGSFRLALGVALAAAMLLTWVNLAVGVLGEPGDAANLLYAGVLVAGMLGTVLARLKPRGMARTMLAMALILALIAVFALATNLDAASAGSGGIAVVHGFLVALFLISAMLFQHAARTPDGSDAAR